jgi:hypothetical protein
MDVFLLIEKGCGTILTFIFLINGSQDCPNFRRDFYFLFIYGSRDGPNLSDASIDWDWDRFASMIRIGTILTFIFFD